MPSRPRPSKVTKHNGSARNRKPLSDTGQQELENHYVVANGNANGHAPIDSPVPLRPGQLALPVPRSSPVSSHLGGGGHSRDNSFPFNTQPNPYPLLSPRPPPSAAELAHSKYGDAIKLDSALSRKVAREEAKREPTQRRPDQKLNIDRRSNMEAFLAHVTGQEAAKPCKNCHKGHGPWTQCVVYDGQMCGSCTNCWYNASGSRCTFHGNGSATAYAASPAAASLSGVPVDRLDDAGGDSKVPLYSPAAKGNLRPTPDWATPHHDHEGTVPHRNQSHAPEQLPGPPPAYMGYHPPPPMPHGLPNVELALAREVGGGGHEMSTAAAAAATVAPWMSADPTRWLIHQAMGDVATLSRRDRHIARIETAAEELAMRIAEFNEYMRTPEGVADLRHYEETAGAHMMPPGHTHDARMETMETESVPGGSPMT